MANAEQLAQGAKRASYTQAIDMSELATDFALGQDSHFIREKYGITKEEFDSCLEKYVAREPLPDLPPRTYVSTEEVPVAAQWDPAVPEAPKPEWHYTAQPRHDFVFLLRLSKEHSSRVIVPDAHKEKSDVAMVWAVGPEVKDLAPGDICLFDKYATVGQEYSLLDEEGDDRDFLMLQDIHIAAILKKSQRKEYRNA